MGEDVFHRHLGLPVVAAVERGPVVDDGVVVVDQPAVTEVVETRAGVGLRTRKQEVALVWGRLRTVGTGDAASEVEDEVVAVVHRELCAVVEAGVEVGVEQLADAVGTGRVEGAGWHSQ